MPFNIQHYNSLTASAKVRIDAYMLVFNKRLRSNILIGRRKIRLYNCAISILILTVRFNACLAYDNPLLF